MKIDPGRLLGFHQGKAKIFLSLVFAASPAIMYPYITHLSLHDMNTMNVDNKQGHSLRSFDQSRTDEFVL